MRKYLASVCYEYTHVWMSRVDVGTSQNPLGGGGGGGVTAAGQ